MANKKTTRRALWMSVISLILCCAMLVGTTFAWFTDEVNNTGNIIKSGNLDVEMYYADGTEAVPADATGWKDASTGAIFNYTLWEPGYTEVRHIKIENKGSLALKYQLLIQANGEVSKLADVIDVYFADPAAQVASREALTSLTNVGTLSSVLNAMPANASGNLEAGETATVTLALQMRTSADNEYKDLAIGSDFNVVLQATQYTSETDSFDKTYDADATFGDLPLYVTGSLPVAEGTTSYEIPLNNVTGGKNGSAVVPAAAVAEDATEISVSIKETSLNTSVPVDSNKDATTYDVTVEGLKADNTENIKITMNIPTGLTGVEVYHNETLINSSYDPNTGILIFESASFSPYTVVYDAESEYVPPVEDESKLPKATVVNSAEYENVDLPWGSYGQWSPTEGLDSQLEAAYTFTCTETLEEAKANPYANWHCDFYVKLNQDLAANQIFLGGNYGSFGWVGFHNGDLTLEANTEIPLLGSVAGSWTYQQVVQNVGTFICGVGDVDNALSGATFTVMLRLTNPDDANEFYNISTINYTFE